MEESKENIEVEEPQVYFYEKPESRVETFDCLLRAIEVGYPTLEKGIETQHMSPWTERELQRLTECALKLAEFMTESMTKEVKEDV